NQPTQLYIRLVEFVTSGFNTLEKAEEVQAFFKENKITHIRRSLDQCIEKIKIRAKWFERDSQEIKKFLS
ncbi:Aminopeptidase, partial [Caligus rogercresseyi]